MNRSTILAMILPLLFVATTADAWVYLFSSEGWTATLDAADLSGGAGSEIPATLESPENVSVLELYSSDDWRIDVARTAGNWPAGVPLSVRVSDSSATNGNVTAPPVYRTVGVTPVELATGRQRRSFYTYAALGLQFRLEDLTVSLGAGSYTTTVIYTITDD